MSLSTKICNESSRSWLLVAYLSLLFFHVALVSAASDQQRPKMHTVFSVECTEYFDWQTVGMMHSYRKTGQPGPITRLLSCTDKALARYKNLDLAPTFIVPSWTRHPVTGDYYPAINKPKGVLHWLENSPEAKDVVWVVILDADQIIRAPITPWDLNAKKGMPVAADYGYLIGCGNILAKLHTKNPSYCDKVGGFIVMHMEDLQKFAPLWLSKTEEVRADTAHYATNITGDVYGQGWISEMYGYSFGAADLKLRHQVNYDLMIYPGYTPGPAEPKLMHYGLEFRVGNWSFGKSHHDGDPIVDECNKLFDPPPFPLQIQEKDSRKKRGFLLSIECVNTLNEGLLIHHSTHGCPEPPPSDYVKFLKEKIASSIHGQHAGLNGAKSLLRGLRGEELLSSLSRRFLMSKSSGQSDSHSPSNETEVDSESDYYEDSEAPKLAILFSVECNLYFDWQTLGLVYSFRKSGQPGVLVRLLSCTEEQLKTYRGMDLSPTMKVPSFNINPRTGDVYSAINKPAGVNYWLEHSSLAKEVEWVLILDADQIIRKPIVPWELGARKGRIVSARYSYLIGCDNILGKLHMRNPSRCDKVGGLIGVHIDDLKVLAPLWVSKTEEVRADKAHYATNITGDVYGQGWISEMYGYSFGASDAGLTHRITNDIMLYPGYEPFPNSDPKLLHLGLPFSVGSWKFEKSDWHVEDVVYKCGGLFPAPPLPSSLPGNQTSLERRRDLISIESVGVLNRALIEYHVKGMGCPPSGESSPGGGDLGLASPGPLNRGKGSGEPRVLVAEGEKVDGVVSKEYVGRPREEKGLFLVVEGNGKDKVDIFATVKKVESKGDGEEESDSMAKAVESGDEAEEGKEKVVSEEVEEEEVARQLVEEVRKRRRFRDAVFFGQDHPKAWMVLPWGLFLALIFGALSSRSRGRPKAASGAGSMGDSAAGGKGARTKKNSRKAASKAVPAPAELDEKDTNV